jgi:hypothetical protein
MKRLVTLVLLAAALAGSAAPSFGGTFGLFYCRGGCCGGCCSVGLRQVNAFTPINCAAEFYVPHCGHCGCKGGCGFFGPCGGSGKKASPASCDEGGCAGCEAGGMVSEVPMEQHLAGAQVPAGMMHAPMQPVSYQGGYPIYPVYPVGYQANNGYVAPMMPSYQPTSTVPAAW